MSKGKRDLFDILGISTYEHSYTELLATLFEERQEWARDFFREVFGHLPAEGTVRTKTQLSVPHEGGGRTKDRLDLVLAFGDTAPDIWVVEAKIKSSESSDQLRRYQSQKAQQQIADELGVEKPSQDNWHYSYLTLEGEEPTERTEFCPITYERLLKILPSNPNLAPELFRAHDCLRNRFVDYYKTRDEVLKGYAPSDSTVLENYLNDTWALIDEANRFHWLMGRIAKDLGGLQFEFGIAQNQAFAKPMCRTRNLRWQGKKYGEDKVRLRECFDVHLELQLISGDSVSFVLHYETNPYKPGLSTDTTIDKEELEEYWESRRQFAHCLSRYEGELKANCWKLTQYPLQLAKCSENFKLNNTVGSFREWVREGAEAITEAAERAGKEVGLWK